MTAIACFVVAALALIPSIAGHAAFQVLAFASLVVALGEVAWRLASRWLPDAAASVFLLAVGMMLHAVAACVVLWTGLATWFQLPIVAGLLGGLDWWSHRICGAPRGLASLLAELPFGRGYRFATAAVVLVFVGAFAIVLLNQLRFTVQDADSMWYHLIMPAEWVRTGSTWPLEAVPTMAQGYPGFRQSLVALLSLPAGNEHLALLGLIEFPLLALATYALARQLGCARAMAVAVGVGAATTPVAFAGLSTQGNDLALAIYLCTAATFCLRSFATGCRGDGWLAGIALGALAATKYSGPGYCALLLATSLLQQGVRDWWSWRNAAVLLVGPIVLAAPWYVRNWLAFGNPLYPARLEVAGLVFDGPLDQQYLATQTLGWDIAPLIDHLQFFTDAHGLLAPLGCAGFVLVVLAVLLRRLRLRQSVVAITLPVLLFATFLHHPFNLPRYDAGYSHRYLIAWYAVSLASTAVALTALVPRVPIGILFGAAAAFALATVTRLVWPVAAMAVLAALALALPRVRERLDAWLGRVRCRRVPAAVLLLLLAVVAFGVAGKRAGWQYHPELGYRDGSSEQGWGACVAYVHRHIGKARIGMHGSHFFFPLLGEPWSNQVLLADQPLLNVPPKTLAEVATWIDANRLEYLVCCRERSPDPATGAWLFDESLASALGASQPGRFEIVFEDRGAQVLRVSPR